MKTQPFPSLAQGASFLFAALTLAFAATTAHADFAAKFDATDLALNGGWGYTGTDNTDGGLAWEESYVMMGYMEMYRGSGNKKYLRKLVAHAEKVIALRDDMIGRVNYRGDHPHAVWSAAGNYTTDPAVYVSYTGHDGMITTPMADFARTVLAPSSGLLNEMSESGFTFQNRANWLVDRIKETIAEHDFEWDAPTGTYVTDPKATTSKGQTGDIMPINLMAAMASTLVLMDAIAPNTAYQNKAIGVASYFKSALKLQTDGSYKWGYNKGSSNTEDISHGSHELELAVLCAERGWVFSPEEIKRFTINVQRIYAGPRAFMSEVDGSGKVNSANHVVAIGSWLVLTGYDRDIYQTIADFLYDFDVLASAAPGCALRGLALAHSKRKVLVPELVSRVFADNAAFAGVAAGNLDNSGVEEVVWVRNSDGAVGVGRVVESDGVASWTGVTKYTGYPATSQWAGVAAGNFDGIAGDEIALVRNSDARIFVMKMVNGALKEIASYSLFGAGSQWAGIAAGNFDGVAGDEIALVRNFDGAIFVMKLSGSTLTMVASNSTYGRNSKWAGIAAGNFDGAPGDEISLVRNFDGRFAVLKIVGGVLSEIASNAQAGSASNWLGMGAGDFDGDGIDEMVATRDYDGNAFTYKMVGGILKSGTADYFYNGLQHGNLAGGHFRASTQSRADLVMLRNIDSDLFIFNVLPGSLTY
jgi:hypothetical protein